MIRRTGSLHFSLAAEWSAILLLVVAVSLTLGWAAASDPLWHHDEIITAERTRCAFDAPPTVHRNHLPDFKKPPLHYLVSSALFGWIPDRELSVRLLTVLQAAGCILLAALITSRHVLPKPGAALLCAALLAGSGLFLRGARVALLDHGMALTMLGLLFAALEAERDSRWWIAAAFFAAAGFFQKNALPFGAWAIIIVLRVFHSRRHLLSSLVALAGSAALCACWVLAERLRWGDSILAVAASQWAELAGLDHKNLLGPLTYPFWLIRDWGIAGILALLAPCIVVTLPQLRSRQAQRELATLAAVLLIALSLLDQKQERYAVVLTVLLAPLIAAVWHAAFPQPGRARTIALVILLAGTLPTGLFHLFKSGPKPPLLTDVADRFASELRASEQPLLVVELSDFRFNAADFLAWRADLDRPLAVLRPGEPIPPVWKRSGLLAISASNQSQPIIPPGALVIDQRNGIVLWRILPEPAAAP